MLFLQNKILLRHSYFFVTLYMCCTSFAQTRILQTLCMCDFSLCRNNLLNNQSSWLSGFQNQKLWGIDLVLNLYGLWPPFLSLLLFLILQFTFQVRDNLFHLHYHPLKLTICEKINQIQSSRLCLSPHDAFGRRRSEILRARSKKMYSNKQDSHIVMFQAGGDGVRCRRTSANV